MRERERERERGKEPKTDMSVVCTLILNFSSTYHCVEEECLEVVMETRVHHTTIVVEE